MSFIECQWFCAGSSRRIAAQLRLADGALHVKNADGEDYYAPLSALRLSSRLGNTPREIRLPNGALLSVADNDYIDAALRGGGGGIVHYLEKNLLLLPLLLALAAAVLYTLYAVGLPRAAEEAARHVPRYYASEVSRAVYDNFTRHGILQKNRLTPAAHQRAWRLFGEVQNALPPAASEADMALQLRLHRMAFAGQPLANAFALPNGMIIITDELLRLLNDEEVKAVIAHEIGHVRRRHGLRAVVQASGAAVLVAALLGDYSGLSVVPLALLQLSYSRDFEREADCFAYHYLKENNMSPTLIGTALLKLEASQEAEEDAADTTKTPAVPDYSDSPDSSEDDDSVFWQTVLHGLSTHPQSDERADASRLAQFCAA